MAVQQGTPDADDLPSVIAALREWQSDGAAFQLHPGDLGWFERFGAQNARGAVRSWSRDGRIVAVGLLDGPDLLRLTMAPDQLRDEQLARQLVDDLTDPTRGVLPAGAAYLETPMGVRVRELLSETGWETDEGWTPLQRDLGAPVETVGLRVERVERGDSELAATRVAVQRASFVTSTFTLEAWRAMAEGEAFADARDLVGFDEDDNAVAVITVWSAGPGRPGLVEPMGVHRDHQRHGYGRAITLAGAAALRDLGASSAVVCTRTAKVAAVSTYEAARFTRLPERFDLARGAHAPS
jgi:ribosomal protein S18 acetylase RimI-like enzyme